MTKRKKVRLYKLEEFKKAVDMTGARPLYTLNMMTGDLEHSLAMLEHAKSLGILPEDTMVELGGEFYWGKYSGCWATGHDYALEANVWAKAIRSKFTSVTILAVACHSIEMKDPNDRGYEWNGQVYSTVSNDVDGVSIHPYLHLADDSKGGGPLQPLVPPRVSLFSHGFLVDF
jgi:alpha-L-arabinofuranosidase